MQTRNAASVLPDPVGAAISVCRPAAISCHPAACGSVGPAGNRPSNQARTAGWNDSSTRSRYLRPLTFLPETGPGPPNPARAGGPWLWSTLVLSLFHAVVVPSGLSTRVQPQRWIAIWWWKLHSSTQSAVLVLPPLALCLVWCTSHAEAGWSHPPAHRHLRSRKITALRIP